MSTKKPYATRSSEFIAWYPNALDRGDDSTVWEKPEAAFYIHIPFCDQICDYCGFAVARRKNADIDCYVDCLVEEIQRNSNNPHLLSRTFTVGHFGGGTPSVLEVVHLERILTAVASVVSFDEIMELTLEANPISLTKEKAREYRRLGINRLSIGVQSFSQEHLRKIGRPHRPDDAVATYKAARDVGFDNISIDLMYGLPGQTATDLQQDIDKLVSLAPDHISCFPLEVIPLTPLALRQKLGISHKLPKPDDAIELHSVLFDGLRNAGYRHYGAMNFALPGKESEHNRIAFVAPQGEYIGWGNSAYSFFNSHVFCNDSDLTRYIEAIKSDRSPVSYVKKATQLELASRMVMFGLKFLAVKRTDFEKEFGVPFEHFFESQLSELSSKGLLVVDDDAVSLTELGILYVNNVCKEFFTEENRKRPQWIQYQPTIDAKTINAIVDKAQRGRTKHNVRSI